MPSLKIMKSREIHDTVRSRAPRSVKTVHPRKSLRRGSKGADLHVLIPELVTDPVQVSRLSAKGVWRKSNNALIDSFSLIGYSFKSILCESPPSSSVPEVMSILKNWTAFFLPWFLGDDTPPQRFNPLSLCSSGFRAFLMNRKTGNGKSRKIRIGALILYSKRLFPSFTGEMVREKVKEFGKAVSRVSPPLPYKKRMYRSIDASVSEFLGSNRMVADYSKPFAPSTSACYERSRSDGGLQSFVSEEILQETIDSRFFYDELKNIFDVPGESLSFSSPSGLWNEFLDIMFRRAVMETVKGDGSEWDRLPVQATGLTEPLKVRIVTKSNWFLQLLTPIQKAWHTAMRSHEIYQLIGGVPVVDAIKDLLLSRGQKVVSGDYSAATDNIYLEYTEYAARAMLDRTDFSFLDPGLTQYVPWIKELVIKSLVHSQLELKGQSPVDITRGQMMGHILSFPLLCLINRSASVMAIPRGRFMRINGDDVLFPANPKEYRKWKKATASVGLEFSLGKNYFSRDLALVNSTYCVFDKSSRRWEVLDVPNVGLLNMPMDKQIDTESGRQIMPWEVLAQNWREFSRFSTDKTRPTFVRLFLQYYPILRGFPGPIYGPTEWGGLGAPIPEGHKFTRNQLMWMNAHRLGLFSFLQGTRNDYSRLSARYQLELEKYVSGIYEWHEPSYGEAFGPLDSGPFLDPYQKDGGFAGQVMALRRWVVDASSMKHIRIFGARRWNQFKLSQKTGIPPLPLHFLDMLRSGDVFFPRPGWYRSRDMTGTRYEDRASYLHVIFPDTVNNKKRPHSDPSELVPPGA